VKAGQLQHLRVVSTARLHLVGSRETLDKTFSSVTRYESLRGIFAAAATVAQLSLYLRQRGKVQ